MKLKTAIFILLGLVLLVAIKFLFLKPENAAPQKAGPQKAPILNVTGFVIHAQELQNAIYSSGTILANEEVVLRPEVQGKLIFVNFKEGTQVLKGTLLAKINDADLQAQAKKLQLQLKIAKEKEFRLKGLLAVNGVSQQDYDEIANQLETLAADLEFTSAQIAKTEIHAPFNGTIGLKQISEGSFVTNATIIARIVQTDLLKLDFAVPEKYAGIVNVGDTVYFTVQNENEKFRALVIALEPRIDEQTRNILIRAIYLNTDALIYPGAFARIELHSNKKLEAIMIPTEAVIPELKGKKVFICKGGKAVPQKVKTGLRTDAQIEIVEGLQEGDTLIVTGIMSLKPDALIKIVDLKK